MSIKHGKIEIPSKKIHEIVLESNMCLENPPQNRAIRRR